MNTISQLCKFQQNTFDRFWSVQQISVKKLDKINIQLLFKDCRENNYFLFCFNKEYLPLSFFPLSKIQLYFSLPANLTSSFLLLNIFKSHKNIIFKEHNSFFLLQSQCIHIPENFASKSPFQENKVRKCIFTHFWYKEWLYRVEKRAIYFFGNPSLLHKEWLHDL